MISTLDHLVCLSFSSQFPCERGNSFRESLLISQRTKIRDFKLKSRDKMQEPNDNLQVFLGQQEHERLGSETA